MKIFFVKLFYSFRHAFNGVKILSKGTNFKIMVCFEAFLLLLGAFFRISLNDLIILLVLMGILFAFEALNTMLERLMDFLEKSYSEKVKEIKDTCAAMVLIFSIFTILAEFIIFMKYFIKIISPLFRR
jgi:diacylglycerol kinase